MKNNGIMKKSTISKKTINLYTPKKIGCWLRHLFFSTVAVLLSFHAYGDTQEVTPVGGASDTRTFDGNVDIAGQLDIGDINLSTVSNNELVLGSGDSFRIDNSGTIKFGASGLLLSRDGVDDAVVFQSSKNTNKAEVVIEPTCTSTCPTDDSGWPQNGPLAGLFINRRSNIDRRQEQLAILAYDNPDEYRITQILDSNPHINAEYRPLVFMNNGEESFQVTTSADMLIANNKDLAWKNASGTGNLVLTVDANDDIHLGDVNNNFDRLIFWSGGNTRMTILDDGKVGIGTTNPGESLDVIGNVDVTGSYLVNGADYAEYFQMAEPCAEFQVVSLDKNGKIHPARQSDDYVLGIVSVHPSVIGNSGLAENNPTSVRPVALLGRVKAAIVGHVEFGDWLTVAETEGFLRKAKFGERHLARALEDGNNIVEVMVGVDSQQYQQTLQQHAAELQSIKNLNRALLAKITEQEQKLAKLETTMKQSLAQREAEKNTYAAIQSR